MTAEHPQRVQLALDWFREGMGFADALHVAACAGDESFTTFDRKLIAAARKAKTGRMRAL